MANRRLNPTGASRQIITNVAEPIALRIEREAEANGVPKSEVMRTYIEAGIAAADSGVTVVINGKRYYQAD